MAEEKSVKCVVLDAGPLILNDPSISSLLAESEQLFTTSTVIAEIKDPAARARLQTTVTPFLTVRDPSPASIKVVSDFARRTGDLAVLSRTDLHVLALAYELECEKNGGDWRLRRVPGQKTLNGAPPGKTKEALTSPSRKLSESLTAEPEGDFTSTQADATHGTGDPEVSESQAEDSQALTKSLGPETSPRPSTGTDGALADAVKGIDLTSTRDVSDSSELANAPSPEEEGPSEPEEEEEEEEEPDGKDDGEWITPANLASHKAKDASGPGGRGEDTSSGGAKVMQVATMTTDYAMQNVLLQMNLNLLSTGLRRIQHVKSHVLRCHACFATTRDMARQFCARCGAPAATTLTRVSCSTGADGTFVLHLKKNFRHNGRGNRYSVPKPVSGSANGRVRRGGGKGGWGNDLILSEDQKEYQRAMRGQKKNAKEKNLMDEDYLPGILTGDRAGGGPGGRPKVGAGRDVNSRKR